MRRFLSVTKVALFLGLSSLGFSAVTSSNDATEAGDLGGGPGTGSAMGPIVGPGATPDSSLPYWVTADFEYTSAYVFRGLQRAQDSFAPSIEVGYTDYYLGVYSNQPLHGHVGNEFDIYGGYRREIVKNLAVGISGTYFRYPDAGWMQTKETYEVGLDLAYNYKQFTATVFYFRDFKMKSDSVQGTLQYSFPIDAIQSSLDVSFTAGTVHATDWFPNAGFDFAQSYRYHGFTAGLPFRITKKASFKLGVNYAHNDNFVPGVVDKDVVWMTAGFRLGFLIPTSPRGSRSPV